MIDKPVKQEKIPISWIILEVISAVGILLMTALLCISYKALPAHVPLHFNSQGFPDFTGSKGFLFFIAVAGIGFFIISLFSNKITLPPGRNTAEIARRSRLIIALLAAEISWMLAIMEGHIIRMAMERPDEFLRICFVAIQFVILISLILCVIYIILALIKNGLEI